MDIIPITRTLIDWSGFNARICDFLDRSPYAGLREPVGDYRTFLLALGRLSEPSAIAEAFDHLSFGFILHGDSDILLDWVSRTRLRILVATSDYRQKTAIVSGTLAEYRWAIQEHLQRPNEPAEHRQLYNTLMLYFEHIGLAEFWQSFGKRPQSDGTFLLESM